MISIFEASTNQLGDYVTSRIFFGQVLYDLKLQVNSCVVRGEMSSEAGTFQHALL
jgi:hypothetical protein